MRITDKIRLDYLRNKECSLTQIIKTSFSPEPWWQVKKWGELVVGEGWSPRQAIDVAIREDNK